MVFTMELPPKRRGKPPLNPMWKTLLANPTEWFLMPMSESGVRDRCRKDPRFQCTTRTENQRKLVYARFYEENPVEDLTAPPLPE